MSDEQKKIIYSNFAMISYSLFDFQIDFGLKLAYRKDDEKDLEELVSLHMSPQHTKAFLNLLMNNVEEYEKTYGEINLKLKGEESNESGGK